MAEKKSNSKRARNWCAVVYPDSAPEDWKKILDGKNLKWACSPLHSKDIDDDEQIKKAHWHIIICYEGNKSFEQVQDDISELNGPIPQVCRNVRSSVRYFIHLDHPYKFQYNVDEIECFGGFDIADAFTLSKSEKIEVFKEIIDFIRENDIVEYYDLVNYALEENHAWFSIMVDGGTIMLREYIKSNRHRMRHPDESED